MKFDLHAAFNHIAHSTSRVVILGSMNADYTVTTQRLPQPGETVVGGPLRVLPGGKSANQASAASRIGAQVTMLGAVGDDSNGTLLLSNLLDAGVSIDAVKKVHGPSGTTVITVDANAENTIVYSAGANGKVDSGYVNEAFGKVGKAQVLGLCLESPIGAVTTAAEMARASGIKVLLNNSPFRKELPARLIENADVLLINEHEMFQMLDIPLSGHVDWNRFDWQLTMVQLRRFGFGEVMVTLGADGAYVLSMDHGEDKAVHIPVVFTNAVDTTGCGDAFMGAVLAGLAADLNLDEAATLATYVSAYAATGLGAQSSYGNCTQIETMFMSSDC